MWRSDSLKQHTKKKHRINCKKFSTAAAPHTHSSCGTEHACIYVAAASPLSTNIHCTRGNDTEHVDKFKSYKFYLSSLEIFLYCWKMCDSTLLYVLWNRVLFLCCVLCVSTSYIHDIWKLRQPAAKQWNGEKKKKVPSPGVRAKKKK